MKAAQQYYENFNSLYANQGASRWIQVPHEKPQSVFETC